MGVKCAGLALSFSPPLLLLMLRVVVLPLLSSSSCPPLSSLLEDFLSVPCRPSGRHWKVIQPHALVLRCLTMHETFLFAHAVDAVRSLGGPCNEVRAKHWQQALARI